MVWMRSDVDIPSPSDAGFRPPKAWLRRWALGGMGVTLALALLDAGVWLHILVFMAWCALGVLWFQRDALGALRQLLDTQVKPEPVSADAPAWQEWVGGWYWQTDASHRLCVFQPGLGLPDGLGQGHGLDWAALSAYLGTRPLLVSSWGEQNASALAETGVAQNACERLAFVLDQGQAWTEPMVLPWPDRLLGARPAEATGPLSGEPWRCSLRARARRDAQGRLLGFEGVLTPLLPPAVASGHALAAEQAAQAAHMSESEQEALRYAISHDLRAPLRVVEGFTRIVKEDYGRALDRLGLDHLERVLAASARMNGMIDAILAQSQLAGAPLQRVAVDLSALAREIGDEMVALLAHTGPATLTVADGLHVEADPQLVRRVLENLIGNAFKYSAKVTAPHVEVGVMPATNPAVFYVRDNGAGFDMQHADKLFGMFQRLHSAKEFPGTGVGLAGVQNIVRRHGGRVWAEASPGQGACFYFTLMDAVTAQQLAARSQ